VLGLSIPAGATPIPFSPNLTTTGLETVSPSFGEMMYTSAPSGALVCDNAKPHNSDKARASAAPMIFFMFPPLVSISDNQTNFSGFRLSGSLLIAQGQCAASIDPSQILLPSI